MDNKDRMELYGKISRISRNIGIGCIVAAAVILAAWIILSVRNGKASAKSSLIDEAGVTETLQDGKTASLMLDTRAEAGEGSGSDLAELLAERQVYFAGIEDVVITKETVMNLENMAENGDILMQYEVINKDTGELLETTGLIPSGDHVAWMPGEKLDTGDYTLVFHEKPYFPYDDQYIALTQGNNEVNITIR